jgi:uncharacterized protein YndB with AHSA1/START domain
MKRDLRFEQIYPYPPSVVWQAVTDPAALGQWLMPVFDFAPEVGREFTFRVKPQPGWDGIVQCKVLEIEPERLLRFSWQGGALVTEVTFTLEPVLEGTRFVLEHSGFEGLRAVIISTFLRGGWGKMTRNKLPAVLERLSGGATNLPRVEAECRPSLARRILGSLTKHLPK